jgi:hypothetical protein
VRPKAACIILIRRSVCLGASRFERAQRVKTGWRAGKTQSSKEFSLKA